MNLKIKRLHDKNVRLFSSYRDFEGQLLDSIQDFDKARGVEAMGYSPLRNYCLQSLGMSENQAYTFIRVSRKAVQVPALKLAVQQKEITISSAKVIAPVITKSNQGIWLEKAKTLTKPALEREIVKENPKAINSDRMIPINQTQSEARGVLSEKTRKILERVKELESKRTSKACDLDAAIFAMGELYLQKNDPIQIAQRIHKANLKSKKQPTGPQLLCRKPSNR